MDASAAVDHPAPIGHRRRRRGRSRPLARRSIGPGRSPTVETAGRVDHEVGPQAQETPGAEPLRRVHRQAGQAIGAGLGGDHPHGPPLSVPFESSASLPELGFSRPTSRGRIDPQPSRAAKRVRISSSTSAASPTVAAISSAEEQAVAPPQAVDGDADVPLGGPQPIGDLSVGAGLGIAGQHGDQPRELGRPARVVVLEAGAARRPGPGGSGPRSGRRSARRSAHGRARARTGVRRRGCRWRAVSAPLPAWPHGRDRAGPPGCGRRRSGGTRRNRPRAGSALAMTSRSRR